MGKKFYGILSFNSRSSLPWEKIYNKDYDDDYSDGDPNGLYPEFLISDFPIKNITLYFIKINKYNDKMNEIFNNCYMYAHKKHKPNIIAEIGKSTESFEFVVSVSSNEALIRHTLDNISLD